ncbi:protein AFG2 [Pseudozyma hubeiensis SY62]|uniref:Protein AFG2 n=1 Tax=Pseudozyma hubeiensis (strain SY62) TaxID=1305764 RepID=R9P5M7_PSEHS|nr:protein AFG2 [Pseudozyma hubeiensis SY62]GAC96629.1 protein AFG2 [Pseudozyma hubeiensis SY62]
MKQGSCVGLSVYECRVACVHLCHQTPVNATIRHPTLTVSSRICSAVYEAVFIACEGELFGKRPRRLDCSQLGHDSSAPLVLCSPPLSASPTSTSLLSDVGYLHHLSSVVIATRTHKPSHIIDPHYYRHRRTLRHCTIAFAAKLL